MSLIYSVVIPTRDRMASLDEVLRALAAQQGAPDFEIVVVDDGSTDGAPERFHGRKTPLPLRVIRQEARGPAAARNAGVAAAAAPRIAFLGDDTIPRPDWLRAHHDAWQRHACAPDIAAVGYTTWDSRVRATPFLRYINEQGLQFGYGLIDNPDDLPFNFLYTSNLTIGRHLLVQEPFDESFPAAAWEDTELGCRLKKRGMKLIYAPEAVVMHNHPTRFAAFARRQRKVGASAVTFYELHPELGAFLGLSANGPPPLPPRGKLALKEALVRLTQDLPVELPDWWKEVLRYHYLLGLHDGWSGSAQPRPPSPW